MENIRLLADDNGTIALPRDLIQEKLENITAAIATVDGPAAGPGDRPFTGYEVFFDDDSKELDSDLPEGPAAAGTGPETLNVARDPPDPLSADELQMFLEKNKNDVKRQDSQDPATVASSASPPPGPAADTAAATSGLAAATSGPAVTSGPVATSGPAATDSAPEATSAEATSADTAVRDSSTTDANASISQLAESFGGGETASEDPRLQDATASPNRPKNGLYFYVDWNSFLTVNAGQKNQVNLRFAPKAGNPAHFIKINVP